MAQQFNMQVLSPDELEVQNPALQQDTIQFDVIIDKFVPANIAEFKVLKNNFNIAVKEIVDFVTSKVTITAAEGYAALNAPVNLIALGHCRKNLDLLKSFLGTSPNAAIPLNLKLFYNNQNDTFFGKCTVSEILSLYEDFIFDLVKNPKFQEIETNEPAADITGVQVDDERLQQERANRISDAKNAFQSLMGPQLRHYISNQMTPLSKKVFEQERRAAPSTIDASVQPPRRRRRNQE